ncbi:MAG TPA: GLPGLI family protein [Flavobacteriaceae bacterium]|jgi:GLPGLI family protein|nr:GLPGLI family protein [Flavobacteriaceae bacterium]HBS11290.1 GLPGLI family protein [Flavobacteriaceae bacterium]
MKNSLFKKITFVLVLVTITINAQDFQGKAVYQSKTSMDVNINRSTSGMSPERAKAIEERIKRRLEKVFVLSFNKTASVYKEEEKLGQPSGGGMRFSGGGASGNHYKNIKTKMFTKESEFSGKIFLIKDSLVNYQWKMESETKMIGQNSCFKATTVIKIPARSNQPWGARRRNNEREENKKEEENKSEEVKTEDVIVTAWYTLDIAVSHGPGDFWGLPGLILELSYGNTKVLCTKIVINPKEKVKIKEPNKGKEVTQEKYDKIVEEKRKEMREMFRNRRGRGRGRNSFIIGG